MKMIASVLALTLALAPASAALAKEKNKGKGKSKGHSSLSIKAKSKFKGKNKQTVILNGASTLGTLAVIDETLNCPPGLAKKYPPCIPPGQAKKLGYAHTHDDGWAEHGHEHNDDHDHEHDGDHGDVVVNVDNNVTNTIIQTVGSVLVGDPLIISDYQDYRIERPALGEVWYRVDDAVYRVNRDNRTILQALALADALIN